MSAGHSGYEMIDVFDRSFRATNAIGESEIKKKAKYDAK